MSDRHFTGTHEDVNRTEEGSQVINTVNLFDLELTRVISPRLSVSLGLPYLIAERSNPIRSLDLTQVVARNRTATHGIGDMAVTTRSWLLDPTRHFSGNVALGLGLKLPTGADNLTDSFRDLSGMSEVRTVDQSIQPGDGGFGVIVALSAFRRVSVASLYATGTYLINPRATNGVQTYRGLASEAFMSVPDQYILRAGALVSAPRVEGLSFGLGGRIEGVPSHDLIGSSKGFRRPGYALSLEPAVTYGRDHWVLSASVPVAVRRNRVVSVSDEEDMRHGDAAFADYAVQFGVSYRFGAPAPTPTREVASRVAPRPVSAPDVLPSGVLDLDGKPAIPILGQRLTVVYLWASWCQACAGPSRLVYAALRELEPLGIRTIGISVDESVDDARAGAAALSFDYPVFFGGADFLSSCAESQVPATLLLDSKGRIVDRISGPVTKALLRERIERALGGPVGRPQAPPVETPEPPAEEQTAVPDIAPPGP